MKVLLQESVLALNKEYLAIAVIAAKDAISNLFTGKASVITESYELYSFEEWAKITKVFESDEEVSTRYAGILRSPSIEIFVPQVVIFTESEYTSPHVANMRFSRRNILQRDHNKCQYCGNALRASEASIDHIIPKSKGGMNTWQNLVTACIYCNAKKGDKLLSEIGWKLLQQPTEPQWKSHIGTPFNQVKKEYWKNFLK